jgi:purine nucleoside permease
MRVLFLARIHHSGRSFAIAEIKDRFTPLKDGHKIYPKVVTVLMVAL